MFKLAQKGDIMKTKTIILGIVLMIANLCSAGSLWKASPFDSDRGRQSRAEAVDRVNLWPFFYHYKPYTSALWPMFDKRDDGHAFRPFYSVYDNGDELNILWPLSSFNFKKKEHHVGNVFWETNVLVAFPFYFYEKDDYWLATFVAGKGKNWYSVIPPMWIHTYKSPNDYSYFCLPLLTYFGRENSDYNLTTFPLYHQSKDGSTFKQNALLGMYGCEKNRRSERYNLFPLFYKKKEKDRNILITPLFGTLMGSNVYRVITPLLSVSHSKKDHFVNILGPLYNYAWNDDNKYKRTDVIWPLFTHKSEGETRTIASFPLARFKKSEIKKSGYILWPLYNYKFRTNGSSSHIVFPLFSRKHRIYNHSFRRKYKMRGWSFNQKETMFTESATQNWSWILPFTYWNERTYYEKDFSIPIPNEIKSSKGDRIDWKKAEVHTNIWKSFAKKRNKPYKQINYGSFPFFSYSEKENRESRFRILVWLYDSKWTAAKKDSLNKTHWRVLWRLVDYEKYGENVSLDVFPFVTYDKVPEEEISQFSVLWRLFRRREEKDKRALDILFIPIIREENP